MWTENTCVQQYYLYDIVKYKEKTADKLSISSQVTDEHKPSVCAIVESIMIEVDTLNGLLVVLKQNKTKTKSNKQTNKKLCKVTKYEEQGTTSHLKSQSPLPLLWIWQEDQATHCNLDVKCLGRSHVGCLDLFWCKVDAFVFVEYPFGSETQSRLQIHR